MPQSLVTPAFAGLSLVAESGIKSALTTGMTTDRKIFDFLPRRDIMVEIEYPGIAKLVSRLVWDQGQAGSTPVTRTSKNRLFHCGIACFCNFFLYLLCAFFLHITFEQIPFSTFSELFSYNYAYFSSFIDFTNLFVDFAWPQL